ncbi:MAG TPA: hypothetical protein VHK91_02865 [Flavisolibacter sp.]|jgi:hypothetical protein|nr:hypothetical protein [Flavisolibacter sp.]
MRAYFSRSFTFLILGLSLFSCKKETEEVTSEALTAYYPLTVGKSITYRTDSTVFTSGGYVQETHSYQERQDIELKTTDNSGRPSYRVQRFLRDAAGTQPWVSAGSYFVTPAGQTLEVVENNLRFVKLILPVKQDVSWKGNRYLPENPYIQYGKSFTFDDFLADWEFNYESMDDTFSYKGQTLNEILTVKLIDESINVPITDTKSYATRSYGVDKYAKGVGLVYQELILWEYQPPVGSAPSGYQVGFGIKRTMIDHN